MATPIMRREQMTPTKLDNANGWHTRHRSALTAPRGPETGIVHLLIGIERYAEEHKRRYESTIGDDGALGPAWGQLLDGVRSLLDGELGRLDGGSLWSHLDALARAHGFEGGLDEAQEAGR